MSKYGTLLKNHIALSIIDALEGKIPWRLQTLSIEKWEFSKMNGIMLIRVYAKGNPLPATFTVRITEKP